MVGQRVLHSYFWEISEARLPEFLNRGYKQRHFFPHKSYFVPKCGPDGLKMAQRMCGVGDTSRLWEIVLYAPSPLIDEFPPELFFDNDLVWHQQQFGKPGHIAFADLVVTGHAAYGMNYISDLVQRISRRREHKTRIENRFKGWAHMLLNSILHFALEQGVRDFYSATADLTVRHADPTRHVQREMFDRIYDRTVTEHWRVQRAGDWWRFDLADNKDAIVVPERKTEEIRLGKTICLCHDIERGYGHIGIDPALVQSADQVADHHLDEMLAIERGAQVTATYNVLGRIFNEVRDRIEDDGHCIAFHSYDHTIEESAPFSTWFHTLADRVLPRRRGSGTHHHAAQLERLREIDYRIKGYRPPRSRITAELSDERLCYHNFEWLASSAYSLGIARPTMRNRVVRIPIQFDDFGLYRSRGRLSYEDWEDQSLSWIEQSDFAAFSLHDCYAGYWLPHYDGFLRNLRRMGTQKTLDQVAAETTLASCG